MNEVEKLSITLPTEMARMVRDKVEGGDYASNSEVIREALRTWQEREDLKANRLDVVRKKLAEAAENPRPRVPAEKVRKRLEALHQETVKARPRGA
jgi:antitoxin ParD1/3/4